MKSRYIDWWEGKYNLHGPYRKPSLAQRLHRYIAWLLGVD